MQEGKIQRVDMSTPEPVTVRVTVNGRGRAVVHGRSYNIDDNKAKPQNGDTNDDDDDSNGKKEDNNEEEEQQTGGVDEASLSPSASTSTDPVNDEL